MPYIGRGGRLKKLHLELTWTSTWFGRVNSLSCVFKTAHIWCYIGRRGRLKITVCGRLRAVRYSLLVEGERGGKGLDAESTSAGLRHLQGLKRDAPTFKIARTDRTRRMQGRLYIGVIITMVQYKQG